MASDGLWNRLTNEQAVHLVATWLQKYSPSIEGRTLFEPPPGFGDIEQERANIQKEARTRGKPEPQKAYPVQVARADAKQFTLKDNNAATHLVRNALGGSNEDMLRGLLTVPPPYSRNMRQANILIFYKQAIHLCNHVLGREC